MINNGLGIYKNGNGGSGTDSNYFKIGTAVEKASFVEIKNNTSCKYLNGSIHDFIITTINPDIEVISAAILYLPVANGQVRIFTNGPYNIYELAEPSNRTVEAGKIYNILVTGNSYFIEEVSSIIDNYTYRKIGNFGYYRTYNINNLVWMIDTLIGELGDYKVNNGIYYYRNISTDLNIDGWRLPTKTELKSLNNAFTMAQIKADYSWISGYNGNNQSYFEAVANGYMSGNDLLESGEHCRLLYYENESSPNGVRVLDLGYNRNEFYYGGISGYYNIRLVNYF